MTRVPLTLVVGSDKILNAPSSKQSISLVTDSSFALRTGVPVGIFCRTLYVVRETTPRLARFSLMPRKHEPDILDWLGATDEQAGSASEPTLRSLEWVCTECRVVFYSDMPIVPPPECDFCGCCYFETEKAE